MGTGHLLRPWAGVLLLGLGLLTSAGCGGPKLHPVKGKVVFPDGSPLTGGIVEFEAMDAAANQLNAKGAIQPDGTFELGTFKERDGAVAGDHRALVIPPLLTDEMMQKGAKPAIDSRFRRYETSGLKYTVNPGANEITVTVKKPGP